MASKARKKNSKRSTAAHSSLNIHLIEKEFKALPTKLAAQYRHQATHLKQSLHKLKAELHKAEAQQDNLNKKLLTLHSAQPSANNRKQLAKLKKSQQQFNKTTKTLHTQMQQAQKQLEAATNQQDKWTAVNKHLASFDKEWRTRSTQAKPKPMKQAQTSTAQFRDNFETAYTPADETETTA